MRKEKLKAFTSDVFRDMAGAMTAGLAYIGVRTGLFRAMDGEGPMTIDAVVTKSGLHRRYVEEWLNGMASAGYLEYDPERMTFSLPPEHAFLLASDDTDHFAGGLFHMAPALLGVAPQVAEAFEKGGGVPFHEYGEDGILALDLVNRGNYQHRFADYWLKAVPDVVDRLERGARVLDVGCGSGHVCLALAKAYPASTFHGVDLSKDSIERARASATGAGLSDRVSFAACRIEELDPADEFDLITACDCVHDFTRPVEVLEAIKSRLTADGTLFVIEPKAADRLEDNFHPIGTMFYGFSVFHCMTQSLADGGAGLGTCMGPQKITALMNSAGFSRVQALDIKSNVNLFFAVAH